MMRHIVVGGVVEFPNEVSIPIVFLDPASFTTTGQSAASETGVQEVTVL